MSLAILLLTPARPSWQQPPFVGYVSVCSEGQGTGGSLEITVRESAEKAVGAIRVRTNVPSQLISPDLKHAAVVP